MFVDGTVNFALNISENIVLKFEPRYVGLKPYSHLKMLHENGILENGLFEWFGDKFMLELLEDLLSNGTYRVSTNSFVEMRF